MSDLGYVFRSAFHPGSTPAGLVYARWLVRPLAMVMLPVMIVASLLVLSRFDPLLFLAWSVPLAYLLATGWTGYNLGRTPAECIITDDAAAVRTVWQVARDRDPEQWWYVIGVKDEGTALLVSLGRTVYEFAPVNWPEFDAMRDALTQALLEHRHRIRER